MPGGVGGVASRDVPLSRSTSDIAAASIMSSGKRLCRPRTMFDLTRHSSSYSLRAKPAGIPSPPRSEVGFILQAQPQPRDLLRWPPTWRRWHPCCFPRWSGAAPSRAIGWRSCRPLARRLETVPPSQVLITTIGTVVVRPAIFACRNTAWSR